MPFRRLLPPYNRILVFFFCGAQLFFCSVVLAIHQTFWQLSTQIFPTAYQMFDDTRDRDPDNFQWNKSTRQQLDRYQLHLQITWVTSCICISICMLCIIPQFCKVEMAENEEEIDLCVRQPCFAQLLTPLFILSNFLLFACLITEWMDFPADDWLFHSLFHGAIKEEVYLSSFEEELNCLSDEDKEGFDVWKCDRIIERAILNSTWLTPLLVAQIVSALFTSLIFVIFNKQEKLAYGLVTIKTKDEEVD